MIKIIRAIEILRPNETQYSWNGDTYEGLTWLEDAKTTKPTEAEFNSAMIQATQDVEAEQYKYLRAKEYPPIGDQLDALWKGGAEAAAMKAQIDAVKTKYPKPIKG